jgi:protein-S-isoprenylcysteine O-methyltransferase Ste14
MSASFAQLALFGSILATGLLALVLPMVRHRLSHGQGHGLMLAQLDDPVSKVVGVGMACQNAAVFSYALLHLLLDPAQLGVWASPAWTAPLGFALNVFATAVLIVGQAQMGKSWRMCVDEQRTLLVTSGLFAVCRNPIYAASVVLLAGMLLLAPSAWAVCLLGSGFLLVSLQVRLEEAHLVRQHGEAYQRYAARVGRLVPGVGLFPSTQKS